MASTLVAEPSSTLMEYPNWLEVPHEVMANILQRLGSVEILKSAVKVCPTWRSICKEPSMWKVIAIHRLLKGQDDRHTQNVLEKLTKQAVDLSCGELIDISIDGFGRDDLLDYIVLRSSKLKSLSLQCHYITDSALKRALERLPQLEKFHPLDYVNAEQIEFIGRNCPQLKSFRMHTSSSSSLSINCDDYALAIANNMPELRHLEVIDSEMTNDGLKAILNGCPHLQSLDVSRCRNLYLGGKLGKLCMERVKDFKPNFDLFVPKSR